MMFNDEPTTTPLTVDSSGRISFQLDPGAPRYGVRYQRAEIQSHTGLMRSRGMLGNATQAGNGPRKRARVVIGAPVSMRI